MKRQRIEAPTHWRRSARHRRGSVVTYGVVGMMVVSLFIYLVVAYFAEDGGDPGPAGSPGSVAEESR